jgi:cellulose synthase/poly-beta-1,6-N-acetylglucosamine synthase-like glycosyltransferase
MSLVAGAGFWLIGLYLVASGLAVSLALLLVIQTWEHHRFARSRLWHIHQYPRKGPMLLIVPCRGVDVGLEDNLRSLFRQDYGDLRIRFVVSSADDPACAVIRRLMHAYPKVRAELLVAGIGERIGQKVHKLRVATADLPPETEYLAFADSDARLRRQGLRALVARLDRTGVGAATGYRWFVPAAPTLANHLLYSLNSRIAVLFGTAGPAVVWGGSWAIRRQVFESLGIRGAWDGTLSDDLVASRLLGRAGLKIIFEPACMVTSPADVSMRGLMGFVRRQYLMGRLYTFKGWAFSLLVSTFVHLVAVGNLGLLGYCLGTGAATAWIPAGVCGAWYLLSVLSGLLRQDMTLSYFPHLNTSLRRARHFELWSGPLVALVNWISLLGSAVGREIRWRGIVYRVDRGGRVCLVRGEDTGGREAGGDGSFSPEPAATDRLTRSQRRRALIPRPPSPLAPG